MRFPAAFALALVGAASVLAQDTAIVRVDASASLGEKKPVWAFFGYDEPNYTYMKDGKKLLSELQALSPVPVFVRAHSLLVSGDGKPALKWGSTNAYTEDASGKPVYDWTIVDRIIDTYLERKMKPLIEIGFMPEALSVKPQPYRHDWDPSQPYKSIYTGWAYPPKDYDKWSALIEAWVKHSVDKYGKAEVDTWYWEVWNEPNIGYWQSTPQEYFKLYDYTVAAAKKALPSIRIGGPTSTGPGSESAAKFLRDFLEHVVRGTNYKTGKVGTPIDYITFHAKGRPSVVGDHVRMGSEFQMRDIDRGFEIVASFPELRQLPIIIGESDPEGCAACSVRFNPQNNYRNGTMYPSYTAATFARKYDLAAKHKIDFEGAVTWAFEFEDQPWFEGFRDLATNGVDKPVLGVFRMFGMMGNQRVRVESDRAVRLDDLLKAGVKGNADINGFATRSPRSVEVMVWNYHDDDVPAAPANVTVPVSGLPSEAKRVLVRHYRVDGDHSNSYTAWKAMGSPQKPTPDHYAKLERAGQLEMVGSPEWLTVVGGKVEVAFSLPRQGVSLIQFGW
jgi:xylan 1,4-beta-xylosidase